MNCCGAGKGGTAAWRREIFHVGVTTAGGGFCWWEPTTRCTADGRHREKQNAPAVRSALTRKERERNGREFACREYARAYNRLKTWKRRGKLSAEEWNRRVAYIRDLKEAFLTGELSDAAYRTKLERA